MKKQAFLTALGTDIFFDNQKSLCETAAQHISTAHIPLDISNQTAPEFGTS